MSANQALERTLRKYVLGDLPEPARVAVEEQVIGDPEAFHALRMTEQDLIDAYLDETLSRRDRTNFERQVAGVAGLRDNLEFAETLRDRASTVHADRSRELRAEYPVWMAWTRGMHLGWAASIAALLIVLAGGNIWFFAGRARLQGELSQLRGIQTREQGTLEGLSASVRDLERRLQFELQQRSRLESRLSALTNQAPARDDGRATQTFLLAAGAFRSEGASTRISIAPSSQIVRLRLPFAPNRYGEYRAVLYDAEAEELWAASKLRVDSTHASVTIVAPASTLSPGDYQIVLNGVGPGQAIEPIATYTFRVTRQ